MRRVERYVVAVLMWFSTALWLFEALVFGAVKGVPFVGIAMVLLAVVFFQAFGWNLLLPMRDDSRPLLAPPARQAAPASSETSTGGDVKPASSNNSSNARQVSKWQLQRWPCAPTVH